MPITQAEIQPLDLQKIRSEFPVLHQEVNGFPLVYLDNAATTQKPKVVIEALRAYYSEYNSNIHRGAHYLATKATDAYEATRKALAAFLNAPEQEEVIFTKGTTDGINLVAHGYGRKYLQSGDEILISGLEHHSNIVPWQMVAEEKGAVLKVIPVLDNGAWDVDSGLKLINEKTRIVAINHVSNALGTINPVELFIQKAHAHGAVVLLDGAQASSHLQLDVQALGCDFYVFSGHKMYGPTGCGVLWGKRRLLEAMNPYQGGGEMIAEVSFEKTTYNEIPFKFEAGTPNIADVIALKSAIDYMEGYGRKAIALHENNLLEHATRLFEQIDGVRIVGTAKEKIGVLSFLMDGYHPFDVGMLLDAMGIAVRTGHHCTQPLMKRFGLEGTVRASFAMYNTLEEVEKLARSIERLAAKKRK
jgi:cysteine desulfurase/selenocysteine lyase